MLFCLAATAEGNPQPTVYLDSRETGEEEEEEEEN